MGGEPLEPDWEYLTGKLQGVLVPADRTSFAHVRQVKPAATLTATAHGFEERFHWSPVRFAEQPRVPDPEVVWSTFEQCVSAWQGDSDRTWVELSGGIDSTAVLAAAKRTGREVIALHAHDSQSAAGDELTYAQAACNFIGAPLRVIDLARCTPTLDIDNDFNAVAAADG